VPPTGENAEFIESLREAFDPTALDLELNERMIEAALSRSTRSKDVGCPLQSNDLNLEPAAIDSEERRQAELLQRALAGVGTHPLAELAQALHAAHCPAPVAAQLADDLARSALEPRRRSTVVPLRAWPVAAAMLAMAAGVALWAIPASRPPTESASVATAALAQSRSLAPLFAETFDHATATQRIDRIYAVRSRELRHNRYVTWRLR
jgi:hypothetical protein